MTAGLVLLSHQAYSIEVLMPDLHHPKPRPANGPEYTPEEQQASRIIASLIYHDYPTGPDLDSESAPCGIYAPAIDACRDPYENAAVLMPRTGQLYDCTGGAATAWEGLRLMTGRATPYARLDPLIREIGKAIETGAANELRRLPAPAQPVNGNGAKPTPEATEYTATPKLPIDVNDLLCMERKPVVWYAPSFLREGLGLLVGQPNVGKTPIAIQLAIAIATGGKWLNTVQCKQSKVLYLGAEYSPQELIPMFDISRMGQAIPREQLLVKTIEDDFPTDADAALAELEWYLRVIDVRVIIIDVLTAFLPPEKFKQNVYRGDYSELKPYHRLALQYNASVLGVWHASKRESDPRIMYNGSTGMWAAAASRITMYQDQDQRVRIAAFPRMGDRIDWALTQQKDHTGRRWVLADANPEPVCSPTELIIYRWLKSNADIATPRSFSVIAEMLDIPVNTVKVTLRRMIDKNLISQSRSGGYYIASVTPVTSVTDASSETPVTSVTSVTDETFVSEVGYKGLGHQEAINEPGYIGYKVSSDQPDHADQPADFWSRVPTTRQTILRLYLRSNIDSDQAHAQEMCAEYGIDYHAALDAVRGQPS